MADITAPAPSQAWDAFKALAPSIGQSLVMVVGLLVAVGTGYWVAKPEPVKISLPAADPPKPVPMVAIDDLSHLLAPYGDKLDGLRKLIDERIPAPTPRKAPSRVAPK